METIAFMNKKGGVGKTTLVANIAAMLATEGGKSVVMIDLDDQANLSSIFVVDTDREPSVSEVFRNKTYEIQDCISQAVLKGEFIDNLFIAHSNIGLSQAIREMPGRLNIEKRLIKSMENLDVDYVLIDCPPSGGEAVLNAIYAADKVVVPVNMGGFATNAIQDVLELITEVKGYDSTGEMLESEKVVFVRNKLDKRNRAVNKKVDDALVPINKYLASSVCRVASKMDHAIMDDMPLVLHDPKSELVSDIRSLIKEVF